jgi:hypothetical protein
VNAPEPPTTYRRSRCLFRRAARLPPHTNGVRAAFPCRATDPKRVKISVGSVGYSPANAHHLSTRWMLSAMFSRDPLEGVNSGTIPCANSQSTNSGVLCPVRLALRAGNAVVTGWG